MSFVMFSLSMISIDFRQCVKLHNLVAKIQKNLDIRSIITDI